VAVLGRQLCCGCVGEGAVLWLCWTAVKMVTIQMQAVKVNEMLLGQALI
jgi:hypothetical protein